MTIILQQNGMMVPQNKKVLEYLRGSIIGESELKNGQKLIIINYDKQSEQQLVCLRFDQSGHGKIDTVLNNFEQTLQRELRQRIEKLIDKIAPDIYSLLQKKNGEIEEVCSDLTNQQEFKTFENEMPIHSMAHRNSSVKLKKTQS